MQTLEMSGLINRVCNMRTLLGLRICILVAVAINIEGVMYVEGKRMAVPALFVFGDSLLDTGNNNNLITIVKANSPPYGSDYHNGTRGGRFTNGPVTTDFIAASLNLPSPPPSLSAGDNIERGVNFASGGSGILDATGDSNGQHISMWNQIKRFEAVKNKLVQKLGIKRSSSIISKAIFYITVGGNDYLITYYSIPRGPMYALYSPEDFRDLLISTLANQLKSLYKLGARKIVVASMPNIECVPYALQLYPHNEGECVSFLQDDAVAYNKQLFATVQQLQSQLAGVHFIYNNVYDSALDIYHNPSPYGIVKVDEACCGGRVSIGVCFRGSKICPNASQYYYFDGFHPTSIVHDLTTRQCISGSPPYVFPFNLNTLASLQ